MKEHDYAILDMMGATDKELFKIMTPEQIAAFRAWQDKRGVLPKAYLETLNLAAPLQDGSKVLVPLKPSSDPVTLNNQISANPAVNTLVNINTADQKTLETLAGIGESKANAIITYRTDHGPFTSLEQIQEVSAIGPAIFDNIRDLITIY